jgi:hypothetical protein
MLNCGCLTKWLEKSLILQNLPRFHITKGKMVQKANLQVLQPICLFNSALTRDASDVFVTRA